MRPNKERLTVTVDRSLVEAANGAVAAGRADSVSAWVNHALAAQAAKERRLAVLAELITDYEAAHGVITEAELAAQARADRRDAIVMRGARRAARRRRRAKAA